MTPQAWHHHAIYGLTISAPVRIPGLLEVEHAGDSVWTLRFGRVDGMRPGLPGPDAGSAVRHDAFGATVLFGDGPCVAIDVTSRAITVEEPERAALEDTATYLSGPVAGLLARMTGRFCLHAAAAVIGDDAVAICGDSEWGKSTTAAALAREGCALLSDDVCAVDRSGGRCVVLPGSPRIRLWPHGAELVYGPDHGLPAITPTWEKLYIDLAAAGSAVRDPRPLGAVWLIAPGIDRVDVVSGARALTALLSSVYLPGHATPDMRARDLEAAAAICSRVPVRLLPARFSPEERVRALLEGGG